MSKEESRGLIAFQCIVSIFTGLSKDESKFNFETIILANSNRDILVDPDKWKIPSKLRKIISRIILLRFGIYVGEDTNYYHVLGGNQNNSVSVTRIAKSRLHQARRTAWKVAQPANVRKVFLEAKGAITTNES